MYLSLFSFYFAFFDTNIISFLTIRQERAHDYACDIHMETPRAKRRMIFLGNDERKRFKALFQVVVVLDLGHVVRNQWLSENDD